MQWHLRDSYWILVLAVLCCLEMSTPHSHYDEYTNRWIREIEEAERNYRSCDINNCTCFQSQIENDLSPFQNGIDESMLLAASAHGVRYQLIGGRLFRQPQCPFEARCEGVEYFLVHLADSLPNTEFVLNVHDHPQMRSDDSPLPVFSFSKDMNHIDILYPAWSFWSGGPAISLYPTGIGRWNETSVKITKAAKRIEWAHRKPIAFFRGSRTNTLRDRLILLSRRLPNLIDAKYTKNQAWRSVKDTLGEQPASELSFEDHCSYKYLFNFAGVAASFRLRHLLLCGSPVFNVGHQWIEFFYGALYPWIHFVEVAEEMNNVEELLRFAHEHDDIMHRIGTRGRAFVESHLRMEDVLCYWRQLLTQYSRLITYRIRRVPSFKRII
uniref:CAP10 family protein CPIJ013394 n=1 Tax=Ascaris suum TaxID=6253 RepID=F1L8N4_ASCSU